MGTNAGKLLGVSLIIAYTSSVLAVTISAAAGYALVPQFGITFPDAVERAVLMQFSNLIFNKLCLL